MGAFKSLTSQDIIVSPLVVKGNSGPYSIRFIRGRNTAFESTSDIPNVSPWPPASSIYASIKQLYYSNTLPNDPQPYIVADSQGNTIEGSQTANVNSRYDNYLQSGLYPVKNFPTGSNEVIAVGIIPQSLFGEYITPNTFGFFSAPIADDGQGNLYFTPSRTYIGNIIYTHGIVIITNQSFATSLLGLNSISFRPSTTIYETQYKCTIRPDEFNYSLNPTLLSGSEFTNPVNSNGSTVNVSGDVVDFVTGSAFSPYVTSVGLYNTNNELLAVAKLSQPIPTSRTVDMNIVINMDK